MLAMIYGLRDHERYVYHYTKLPTVTCSVAQTTVLQMTNVMELLNVFRCPGRSASKSSPVRNTRPEKYLSRAKRAIHSEVR